MGNTDGMVLMISKAAIEKEVESNLPVVHMFPAKTLCITSTSRNPATVVIRVPSITSIL